MTSTTTPRPAAAAPRLRNFPVSFFAVVMGLAGWAIAVQRAESTLGLVAGAGAALAWVAAATFCALALLYAAKLIRHRDAVAREFAHPIKSSFFPAISIGMILLAVALHPVSAALSLALLVAGAALGLALTLAVLARWIGPTTFEVQHASPAWFIPVVGNVLVPVAAVEHGYVEAGWFFFSVGIVFWLVLQTIVFNRMIFHHPLPAQLAPTLFILMAPPAVAFIAYVKLAGVVDGFARVLFYTALFMGLLLLKLYRSFLGIRFFLSWWAYSFPLAALTIATLLMYERSGGAAFAALAWALLALLTALVAALALRTVKAIAAREICVEE